MAVDQRTVFKNIVFGLVVALGLFSSILLLSNSWIKLLLGVSMLLSGIAWLVSRGSLKKAIKYLVLSLMIFGICFTSFERYVFWNAGYPSTYKDSEPYVTISYPGILNVSLTEVVKSAKETAAFSLFSLEHPGDMTFEFMGLYTDFRGGRVDVGFYNEASNTEIGFTSSDGYPFHAQVIPYGGQPPSRIYSQHLPPEESLRQIDELSLGWFFNYASETYQNRTGNSPNIASLEVSTQWQEYEEYGGLILQIIAYEMKGSLLHGTIIAAFQPDGTPIYINTPDI